MLLNDNTGLLDLVGRQGRLLHGALVVEGWGDLLHQSRSGRVQYLH